MDGQECIPAQGRTEGSPPLPNLLSFPVDLLPVPAVVQTHLEACQQVTK